MTILDGKATSDKILRHLKSEIPKLQISPCLDIILIGKNLSSIKYVKMKEKKAKEIGINTRLFSFVGQVSTQEIIEKIKKLNLDPTSSGIMVQLPLPPELDTSQILNSIDPTKDVDGLTATNLGLLFQRNLSAIASATPLGVIKLLEEYKIQISGKNAVVIGRSSEVGLPLVALLMAQNATVTLCHSFTTDLKSVCKNADILISAIGKGGFITSEYVKKGAVVVDIGLSPDVQTGKLIGDIDFESVATVAGYITPVPGGVGPMTVASLLWNLIKVASTNG
ncbi:MAG: bifunctional 5,10-methylenetetrahydrofolate dehydrogenase/5,10-methenyltetrahydrofolate cyclohydrolase [Candidatus Shapirobacteria bacterium]|jgi:methylenetetrahydrofolate dehydrogenase (NADP+)/methenyltetrahydrofolate cyclohydrolase